MNLLIVIPSHRLSGEDRRCWLERISPEIRSVIADYERSNYIPVECIGHFDRKDQFWITIERWIEYVDHPIWQRDIQRTKLLIDVSGKILESKLQPLIRVRKDGASEPIVTPAPSPSDGDDEVTITIDEPLPRPKRRRSRADSLEPCDPSAS